MELLCEVLIVYIYYTNKINKTNVIFLRQQPHICISNIMIMLLFPPLVFYEKKQSLCLRKGLQIAFVGPCACITMTMRVTMCILTLCVPLCVRVRR